MPAACVTSTNRIVPEGRGFCGGVDAITGAGFGEDGDLDLESCDGTEACGCACLHAVMPENANRQSQQRIGAREDIRYFLERTLDVASVAVREMLGRTREPQQARRLDQASAAYPTTCR